MSAAAAARPAATVVVIRDAPTAAGFEVLLVRRDDRVAFMAGAYVFPGGRVDQADADRAAAAPVADGPSRFADLTLAAEQPFRFAAVRELAEEAGVRVAARDLWPIAHWVTPDSEPRRYDTRFFLARMPDGQEARHDDRETTELAWLPPALAIERCRRGEMLLPPPTWTTLTRLARYRTAADVEGWARATAIVRVQPRLVRDFEETMLVLPGDASYPAIEGWEVPDDTRFVLREGQWRPARS